jgi:hypothetical protein
VGKKPRRKLYIGLRVMWFVLISVPKKVKTDWVSPHICQESVNSGLLPGFSETAAPTMN